MVSGLFGYVDLGVLALIAVVALVTLLANLPGLVRYMKMRSM